MKISFNYISTNRRGLLCCLGGFLLCLSQSLDYSYPNLNTYITSYLRKNGHNPGLTYGDFIFLSSAKNLTTGIFSFLGGFVSLKLGVKPTIALGCCIMIAGYSCTFFALESVFGLVVLTMGACHGLGFIFVYTIANGTAQKWFPPEVRGLIASIVSSGYGFGSSIWIPLETAFINPDNIPPESLNCLIINSTDVECSDKYFVDEDLLKRSASLPPIFSSSLYKARIPYCFLIIAGVIVVLSILGVSLISESDKQNNKQTVELPSLSPREVVKTKLFYQIYFGFFAISCTRGLLINWQKSFGLELITSDRFHANIGIFTNICNGACRILWGILYDRIGYRKCFIIIGMFVSLGVSSLPLLKYLAVNSTEVKILWSIILVVLYSMIPGTYAVIAASVGRAFGPDYFAPNFGLFFTSTAANFIIIIILSQVKVLFELIGYSGMFLMAGAIGACGVIVTFLMDEDIKYERVKKENTLVKA